MKLKFNIRSLISDRWGPRPPLNTLSRNHHLSPTTSDRDPGLARPLGKGYLADGEMDELGQVAPTPRKALARATTLTLTLHHF